MLLWLKLSATFHEHPKMLAVRKGAGSRADSAELGWYRLLMAAKRYGRWEFASEDHLVHVAGSFYRYVHLYRSAHLLDGLIVHDGDSYNAVKSPAERKADQRDRDSLSQTAVTKSRDTQSDGSVTLEKSREEREITESRENGRADAMDAFWTLLGTYPNGRTKEWLQELVNEFDDQRVSAALAAESKGDRQGLLSRVRDRLRSEADKAAKANAIEATAKLEAEAAAKRITPEQAAENRLRVQAELRKMGVKG